MINWEIVIDYKDKHKYGWKQLSELAGLGSMTIYYWYSKHRLSPRVSYLDRLARLMDVSLDELWIREAD